MYTKRCYKTILEQLSGIKLKDGIIILKHDFIIHW